MLVREADMGLFKKKTRRMPDPDVFTITDTILDPPRFTFCRLSTRMPRAASGLCINAVASRRF